MYLPPHLFSNLVEGIRERQLSPPQRSLLVFFSHGLGNGERLKVNAHGAWGEWNESVRSPRSPYVSFFAFFRRPPLKEPLRRREERLYVPVTSKGKTQKAIIETTYIKLGFQFSILVMNTSNK